MHKKRDSVLVIKQHHKNSCDCSHVQPTTVSVLNCSARKYSRQQLIIQNDSKCIVRCVAIATTKFHTNLWLFFFFFFSESKFYALQCIYWKTYTESHKQMGLIRKSNQALHLTSGGPLTGYRSKYVTRSSFSFWSCQQSLQKTKSWARRP